MAHRGGFFCGSNRPNVKIRQRKKAGRAQPKESEQCFRQAKKGRRTFFGRPSSHQHHCDSEGVEQLATAIALFGCIGVRPKNSAPRRSVSCRHGFRSFRKLSALAPVAGLGDRMGHQFA